MSRFLSAGIHDNLKDYEVELVRNVNISSVILSGIAFFAAVVFYFHSPENIGFGIVFFVPPVFAFALNAIRVTVFSRVVFVVLTSFLVCIAHAYFSTPGKPALINFFLVQGLTFLLLPVLFDRREKLPAGISMLFLIVIFFSFPFFNTRLNSVEDVEFLRSETTNLIFIALNISLVAAMTIYIQSKKFRSEKALKNAERQLADKNTALEKQEKELQNTLDEISITHKEDDKRSWISEGINGLNVVLRSSDDQHLFRKALTNSIKYLDANQGGLYEIKQNEHGEKFFVLKAIYGYEKDRLKKEEFSVNTSGLLGDAYKERAPVYRVEIPEGYMIESGLGDTKPGCIFVVPLVYENDIKGMLELASLKTLTDHEKEYVMKISDILAHFIDAHHVGAQSKDLLEKTNQQTEEMRAQEEEMRQNMEELQATQEELHRKEREYLARIKVLEEKLGEK